MSVSTVREHDYTLVTEALGLHYSTISRIVKRVDVERRSKNKTQRLVQPLGEVIADRENAALNVHKCSSLLDPAHVESLDEIALE